MKREQLLGLIYEAACTPAAWAPALDAIVPIAGGRMGVLFFYDVLAAVPLADVTMCGFSAAEIADYGAHHGKHDPRRIYASAHSRPGHTYVDDRELPFSVVTRSSTYQEFNRPLGLGACMGGTLFQDRSRQGFLAIHRSVGGGPFLPGHVRTLDRLLPHIVRALQLHRQIHATRQASAGLAFALDRMPHATFLVRADGLLLHANRAATGLLANPLAPLRLQHNRLSPADDRACDVLLRTLRQAEQAASGHAAPPCVLHLSSREGGADIALLAVAVPDALAGNGARPILVFAADASARVRSDRAVLAAQFGLTGSEADIAVALAAGDTPEAIAEHRATSIETVRSQAKAIHGKLDVRTQSQLASLVACSLAALDRR